MDILHELITDRSKDNIVRIATYIGNDQARFKTLIDLFLHGEWRVNQRAIWVMTYCVEKHPTLVMPYLRIMLDKLAQPNIHNAIKRNTVKMFAEIEIPGDLQGAVLDCCFSYLIDMQEAIAVKVFSMQVVFNLSKHEPDLLRELAMVIEDQMPYGSAGFKSRGRRILREIQKTLNVNN